MSEDSKKLSLGDSLPEELHEPGSVESNPTETSTSLPSASSPSPPTTTSPSPTSPAAASLPSDSSESTSSSLSSSSSASESLAPNHYPLRFMQGEKPIFEVACDFTKPIAEVKALTYQRMNESYNSQAGNSSAAAATTDVTLVKIMWIFQGQLLRDDKTLSEYKSLLPHSVVHVHTLPNNAAIAEASANAAAAANGLRHRGPAGAAAPGLPVPAGEYLIHPGIGNNNPMHHQNQQVGPLLWKMLFSLFICFIGILWGLVLVFGGKLFSLTALLCLMFLTGVGLAGIVQQAAAG